MDNDKQAQIELLVKQIMDVFQLKQTDSIKNTPKRVAKMLVNELFVGLDNSKFPEYTMFKIDDNTKNNEPIVVENISVYSICEHHFLPFIGKATFKYIPNEEIIGLSKIPRIIDFLSRKPQLQERLTGEIFDTFRKMQPFKEFLIRLNTGMNIIEGLEDVPNEYKEMDTLEKLNEAYKANAESEKDYVEKSQRMKQLNKMAKKLLLKYCNEVDSDEELLSWFGEILNGHKLESIDYTIINLLAEKIVSVADQKAKLAQDINEKDRYVQIRNKTLSRIEPYKANIIRMNLGLNNTAQIINEVAFEDGALGITRDYYRIRAAREEDTTTGLSQLIYPQDGLIRVTIENFNPLRNEYGKEIDEILSKETGAKRANIRPYCSEDTVAVLSETGQPLVGFIREAKEYSQGNTTKIDFEKDYKSFLRRIQSPYSHKYQDNISSNQKEHDTRIANEFFERTSIPEYPVKEDNNSNIETLKEIFGEKELDPRGIVRAGIGKQKQTRS